MLKKRKEEISTGKFFFNESNFQGVYRRILSFIPENKSVFNFGTTCKNLWGCLYQMLLRSSVRLYRLLRLNNPKDNPTDFTFDVFGSGSPRPEPYVLDKELYVSSIDEYEKGYKNNLFFEILGEMNKKHGPCCMISGGYALKHFHKNSKFPHSQFIHLSTCSQDVDVFLLGEKKQEIMVEILTEMKKRFKNPQKYVIFYSTDLGLINVEVRSDYFGHSPEIPADIKSSSTKNIDSLMHYPDDYKNKRTYFFARDNESRGYGYDSSDDEEEENDWGDLDYTQFFNHKRTRNIFQFILKNVHSCPADVFAFFDLDQCKLGYFPGLRKLVCPISFIRSLVTRINFVDLDGRKASYKHYHRIRRYFGRTKIFTSLECEPLLSYYHSFSQPKVDYTKFPRTIFPWRHDSDFGDRSRSGWYYYCSRNRTDFKDKKGNQIRKEQVREFRTLKSFRRRLPKNFTTNSDDDNDEPYICESLGLRRRQLDGKYVYKKRTPTTGFYHKTKREYSRTERKTVTIVLKLGFVLGKDVFKDNEYHLYPIRRV